MAEFYSARGWEIPPLPWTNLSPPFSGKELAPGKLVEMSLPDGTLARLFFVTDPDGYKLEVVEQGGRFH